MSNAIVNFVINNSLSDVVDATTSDPFMSIELLCSLMHQVELNLIDSAISNNFADLMHCVTAYGEVMLQLQINLTRYSNIELSKSMIDLDNINKWVYLDYNTHKSAEVRFRSWLDLPDTLRQIVKTEEAT